MTSEELRAEVVTAVSQSNICCQEQVCDMLMITALFGGDWVADLARAKADATECVDTEPEPEPEPANSYEISYL